MSYIGNYLHLLVQEGKESDSKYPKIILDSIQPYITNIKEKANKNNVYF